MIMEYNIDWDETIDWLTINSAKLLQSKWKYDPLVFPNEK